MDKKQQEMLNQITSYQEKLSKIQIEYWHTYSNWESWQFWVMLIAMFIAPLIILYFLIDRRKILLIGFFGLNIHVWFNYINIWGVKKGLWEYPYELLPFLPGNISLDAALIPVLYMLLYQWTINKNKNYYLYMLILSAFLSFIFKPLLVLHELFKLNKGINYFHIFIAYCILFLLSKLITQIFIILQKKQKVESNA